MVVLAIGQVPVAQTTLTFQRGIGGYGDCVATVSVKENRQWRRR